MPTPQRLLTLTNRPFIAPSLVSRVNSRVQLASDARVDVPQNSQGGITTRDDNGEDTEQPEAEVLLIFFFFYVSNFNNDVHINKTFDIFKRETLNAYFIWKI